MTFEPLNVLTGLLALFLSTGLAVVLVFGVFRLDLWLTRRIDERALLAQGNRSVAIVLGSILICQAMLLRHGLLPVMSMVRSAFVGPAADVSALHLIVSAVLLLVVVSVASVLAVGLSLLLFTRMTRGIAEREEIMRDNVAVALFLAAVLIGTTLIVDQGMEDLARSLIPTPDSGSGVITLE